MPPASCLAAGHVPSAAAKNIRLKRRAADLKMNDK
jgi:hypothetical protein